MHEQELRADWDRRSSLDMIQLKVRPLLVILLPSATLRGVERVQLEQKGHLLLLLIALAHALETLSKVSLTLQYRLLD